MVVVVVVYLLGHLLMCFLTTQCSAVCRLSELKREISSQTEISPADLVLVQHRHCLDTRSETETETVSEVFPSTSEEFPAVVTSVSMATWRSISRINTVLRELLLLLYTYSQVKGPIRGKNSIVKGPT